MAGKIYIYVQIERWIRILTHTFFFKRRPQIAVNAVSARPPPSLALRAERFSRDTAVSFSQALLELGPRADRERQGGVWGAGRREESGGARKAKDKQRSSSWRNFVYLYASARRATPR